MPGEITFSPSARINGVSFQEDLLIVFLVDGRIIATPIAWYPRLLAGTAEQRNSFEVSASGYGLHWPELDEDLSVQGMLRGEMAPWPQDRKTDDELAEDKRHLSVAVGHARVQARQWAIRMVNSHGHEQFPSQEFQTFLAALANALPVELRAAGVDAADKEARETWGSMSTGK